MLQTIRRRGLALGLMACSLAFWAGCSDDDDHDDHGHHLEAVGTMLVHGNDTLLVAVGADPAGVVGELHVYEGETLGPLLIHFLDEEGHWYRPEAEPGGAHSLEILHNQLMIQLAVEPSDWSFSVTGLEEGETTIVVRILHDDHADYVSPELPVHVEHGEGHHGPPVAMRLMAGETLLAESFANGTVSGELEVALGGHLEFEAWFLDIDGVVFQPDEDHSLGVEIEGGGLSVLTGGQIGAGVSPWRARLTGLAVGHEHLVFHILHGDHSHFSSPEFHVDILEP
jgi:hypothetical protein